jgi:transcriptional regulator with XRE-family HTH domain
MTFAQKLRELRDAKGLSEARLAELSGVAFGALHFYALGRRKPSLAAAVKLAHALGVTCEAFADCDDIRLDGDDQESKPAKEPKRRGRPRKDQPAAAPSTPPAEDLGQAKKARARRPKK